MADLTLNPVSVAADRRSPLISAGLVGVPPRTDLTAAGYNVEHQRFTVPVRIQLLNVNALAEPPRLVGAEVTRRSDRLNRAARLLPSAPTPLSAPRRACPPEVRASLEPFSRRGEFHESYRVTASCHSVFRRTSKGLGLS
jgi:hypothetical protein